MPIITAFHFSRHKFAVRRPGGKADHLLVKRQGFAFARRERKRPDIDRAFRAKIERQLRAIG